MATDRIEVDRKSLSRLVAALRKEADGKELRRDLIRQLRVVATPARGAVQAAILSMPSSSTRQPGLRATVASRVRISVRTTGRRAGVAVRALKTPMVRGFKNAPKRLNAVAGWRHPFMGGAGQGNFVVTWYQQYGKPGWFDDTLKTYRPMATRMVATVLDETARRISRHTRG